MASDAQVKELNALYALRSDLVNVTGGIRNALSSAAQCAPAEESELMGLYNQVESLCSQCRDELYAAEREYDDYCYYTDPGCYSTYTADELRCRMEEARYRLQQAERNLQQAGNLMNQARQVIYSLQNMAQSAASGIDAESGQIVSAIEHAAYEIEKYMNH